MPAPSVCLFRIRASCPPAAFSLTDVSSIQVDLDQSAVSAVDFQLNQIILVGQQNTDYNFGNFKIPVPTLSSLSGNVYVDSNNNGTRDAGEPPIAGVIVTLTGTDNLGHPVSESTTTDASGAYSFTNLQPGTYTLQETQPVNFIDGKDSIGTPGGTQGNDIFTNIQLPAGFDGVQNNFGEIGLTPAYATKRSLLFPSQPVNLVAVNSGTTGTTGGSAGNAATAASTPTASASHVTTTTASTATSHVTTSPTATAAHTTTTGGPYDHRERGEDHDDQTDRDCKHLHNQDCDQHGQGRGGHAEDHDHDLRGDGESDHHGQDHKCGANDRHHLARDDDQQADEQRRGDRGDRQAGGHQERHPAGRAVHHERFGPLVHRRRQATAISPAIDCQTQMAWPPLGAPGRLRFRRRWAVTG